MDQSNVDYLYEIANRVNYYFKLRRKAIDYIQQNQIIDTDLKVNILLMAAVWGAHQRDEIMTEEDLLNNFGLVTKEDEEIDELRLNEISLDPSQTHLTLNELFEITVENFR